MPMDLVKKSEMYLDRLESAMTDDDMVLGLYTIEGYNSNISLCMGAEFLCGRKTISKLEI